MGDQGEPGNAAERLRNLRMSRGMGADDAPRMRDKTIVLEYEISILADDYRFCGARCRYLEPPTESRIAQCFLFRESLDRETPPSLGGKVWRQRRCGPCLGASPANVHEIPADSSVVEAAEKWAEEQRALGAANAKPVEANMEERATHAKLVLEAFGRDMPRTEVIHLKGGATVTVEATAFQYRARLEEAPAEAYGPRALLEKQGVSIHQTWNRKTLPIDEMLESFPFGEVLLAMDKAGWKWRGETPTFKRIKEVAGELLRSVDGRLDRAETGGLEAIRSGDEYTLRFPSSSWKEGAEKDLTEAGESE